MWPWAATEVVNTPKIAAAWSMDILDGLRWFKMVAKIIVRTESVEASLELESMGRTRV